MMKYILVLLSVLTMLFASCAQTGMVGEKKDTVTTIEGYAVNNIPISVSDRAYSLSELTAFFPSFTSIHRSDVVNGEMLNLDDINAVFPIEHLRVFEQNGAEHCYLVYPVAEGGKFLVFFCQQVDSDFNPTRLVAADWLYVHALPKAADLENLEIGDSLETVLRLAPATKLNTLLSSHRISYSLLEDNSVIMCTYSGVDTKEWVITTIECVEQADPRNPFASIYIFDLTE